MSYATVQRELEDHFSTQWAAATPVVYDNAPKPTFNDDVLWVRFTVTYGIANQISMGAGDSNFHRFTGIVNVQVFSPLDVGSKPALELADTVVDMLTANRIGKSQMNTAETNILGNDGYGRYQVNVVCPFYFDSIV